MSDPGAGWRWFEEAGNAAVGESQLETEKCFARCFGNSGANAKVDVQSTKRALAWAGFYPPAAARRPSGEADADYQLGLQGFLRAYNFDPRQPLTPGGAPERILDRLIRPAIERDSSDRRTTELRPGETAEPVPAVLRPGWVYENGDWRRETPVERARPKNQPMAASDERENIGGDLGMEPGDDAPPAPFEPGGFTDKDGKLEPVETVDKTDTTRTDHLRTGNRLRQEASDLEAQSKQKAKTDPKGAGELELDALERRYRAIASLGRAAGFDVAAGNLEHFLKGTGSEREIDAKWLRGFSEIQETVQKNRTELQTAIQSHKLDDDRSLAELADGETATIDLKRENRTSAGYNELFFASNASNLTTRTVARVTREGDTVRLRGGVVNNWGDKYDWHKGMAAFVPGFGDVKDSGALKLQNGRGAKSYDMRSEWTGRINAVGRIENGRIVWRQPKWSDDRGR